MPISLPEPFLNRMQELLGSEYDSFIASYDEARAYGLRANTLKINADELQAIVPFQLEKVPWCPEGFYFPEGARPGKHPYYHTGLYYIQEPSAMAPAALLDVQPGDRVLDLCAAPGGKSTQLAARMQGEGVLVANDNNAERVKALVKNIELCGVRNAVVLNELPERMKRTFAGYFNKILIDAPCSGEGMFRKEPDMTSSWGRHSVAVCAMMQRDILHHAAAMLAPGGTLVYSTCTFAPEENERSIARFLEANTDFEVVPIEPTFGFTHGRPEWIAGDTVSEDAADRLSAETVQAVKGTARLWPHRLRGEGHFVAVLRRRGSGSDARIETAAERPVAVSSKPVGGRQQPGSVRREQQFGKRQQQVGGRKEQRQQGRTQDRPQTLDTWHKYVRDELRFTPAGVPVLFGDHLYLAPEGLPDLSGIRVIRPGWYAGMLQRGRFEPSHALAMGLRLNDAPRRIELSADDPRAIRYLKGETLELGEDEITTAHPDISRSGRCLIGIDGFPAGWGKWQAGLLKNEYPPGWRWQ